MVKVEIRGVWVSNSQFVLVRNIRKKLTSLFSESHVGNHTFYELVVQAEERGGRAWGAGLLCSACGCPFTCKESKLGWAARILYQDHVWGCCVLRGPLSKGGGMGLEKDCSRGQEQRDREHKGKKPLKWGMKSYLNSSRIQDLIPGTVLGEFWSMIGFRQALEARFSRFRENIWRNRENTVFVLLVRR